MTIEIKLIVYSQVIFYQVVMEFSHPDGRTIPVLLPACSVLIMTGESRYVWSHAITPRKSDILPISVVKSINCGDKKNISEMAVAAVNQAENKNAQSHEHNAEQSNTSSQNDEEKTDDNILCSKLDNRLTLLKRGIRTSLTFRKTLADPDEYGEYGLCVSS